MLKESVEHLRAQNPDELLAFLCHTYAKLNFVSLWEHLGTAGFLLFIQNFSGCYIKVPAAKKMFRQIDQYRLLELYRRVQRTYAKFQVTHTPGDCQLWHEAEQAFVTEAKKHRLNYQRARIQSKRIMRSVEDAAKWWKEYRLTKARQAKAEL